LVQCVLTIQQGSKRHKANQEGSEESVRCRRHTRKVAMCDRGPSLNGRTENSPGWEESGEPRRTGVVILSAAAR
jgi:hypothetical protein